MLASCKLFFLKIFLRGKDSCYVAQVNLQTLGSSDISTSYSWVACISCTTVAHSTASITWGNAHLLKDNKRQSQYLSLHKTLCRALVCTAGIATPFTCTWQRGHFLWGTAYAGMTFLVTRRSISWRGYSWLLPYAYSRQLRSLLGDKGTLSLCIEMPQAMLHKLLVFSLFI